MGLLEMVIGALAGAAFEFFRGVLADRRAAQAQREVGRLTVERDQAAEGRDAHQRIAAAAVARLGDDDALARLKEGGA